VSADSAARRPHNKPLSFNHKPDGKQEKPWSETNQVKTAPENILFQDGPCQKFGQKNNVLINVLTGATQAMKKPPEKKT
jgi:hypothetical protein